MSKICSAHIICFYFLKKNMKSSSLRTKYRNKQREFVMFFFSIIFKSLFIYCFFVFKCLIGKNLNKYRSEKNSQRKFKF